MKIQVEGNPHLYRDLESGAIVNCSDIEFNSYIESKKRKIEEINQINHLKNQVDQIDNLKNEISEIKDMMHLILSKLDSNS
jgi:CRISPR/Cas system CMR-associated protein Cmr5 small subunit